MKSILVVQEDSRITEVIRKCFNSDILLTIAPNIPSAFRIIDERYFDIVVLNTSYRTGNSIELCRRIKIETLSKILFISSNSKIEIKELCFENGCDDFISMPFYPKELTLRINRLLDNYSLKTVLDSKQSKLILSIKDRSLSINNCTVFLSKNEFLIMEYLIKNNCNNFNLDKLINYLESRKNRIITHGAVVVGIKRLRNKLITGTGMNIIKTRYGLGYYLSI